jgi:hypothetical protein
MPIVSTLTVVIAISTIGSIIGVVQLCCQSRIDPALG